MAHKRDSQAKSSPLPKYDDIQANLEATGAALKNWNTSYMNLHSSYMKLLEENKMLEEKIEHLENEGGGSSEGRTFVHSTPSSRSSGTVSDIKKNPKASSGGIALYIQEDFFPDLTSQLSKELNITFSTIQHVSTGLYAVNHTARFEAANLNKNELAKFRQRAGTFDSPINSLANII